MSRAFYRHTVRLAFVLAALLASTSKADSEVELLNRGLESGRLAFTLERGKREDIYVINFADKSVTALVSSDAAERQPAWSPSGEHLAYSSDAGGVRNIYICSADGSGTRKLTSGPGADEYPTWSPDGNKLAFQSTKYGSGADIFIINRDGSSESPLIVGKEKTVTPAWSPTGKEISYASDGFWPGWDILSYDLESNEPKLLSHGYRSFRRPAWRPDGAAIATAYGNGVDIEIWEIDRGSQRAKQLVWNKGRSGDPVWAAGGNYLFFVNEVHAGAGDYQVFMFDNSTGTTTQITKARGVVRDLSWTDRDVEQFKSKSAGERQLEESQ